MTSRFFFLREEIPKLRRQLAALYEDIDFVKQKHGVIHYSCDFSELYDYLTGTEIEDCSSSTKPAILYDDTRAAQTAGLVSFFNSGSRRPIVLLQPHAKELWGFVRNQRESREKARRLNGHFMDKLDDEAKVIVQAFADDPTDSTHLDELLPSIKDQAEELCLNIASLIEETVPSDVLDRLSDLIKCDGLVHDIGHLARKFGIRPPDPARIDQTETLRLLEMFPEKTRERSRLNKINDCRALLYLREINRCMLPKNHKILFLTRDRNVRRIAYELRDEPWFQWPDAHKFIRTMTGLQYDLQLAQIKGYKKKRELIQEADQIFADVEQAIQGDQESSRFALDHALKKLRDHLALKLSLSLQAIWTDRDSGGETNRLNHRDSDLSRSFTALLRSPHYRELVTRGVESALGELTTHALDSFLREHLQDAEAQIAIEFKQSKEPGVASIALVQSEVTPSIRFSSPNLQAILHDLNGIAGNDDQVRAKLEDAISRIVSVEPDAEDFLFMAYVFCLSKLWKPALRMAIRSQALADTRLNCETPYLIAFVQRRLAREHDSNVLRLLSEAFGNIKIAIKSSGEQLDDARLALELGSICLAYHHYSKTSNRPIRSNTKAFDAAHVLSATRPAQVNPKAAIALLKHALDNAGDHLWLRLTILNNLAYSTIMGFDVALNSATKYCNEIREILADLSDNPRVGLPSEPWPSILQTTLMVDAMIARRDHDQRELRRCIDEMSAISRRDDITEADRSACQEGIALVEKWIDEVPLPEVSTTTA